MALNFPANPTPGQVFTAEGATFIWNGTVWVAASPPVIPWASPEEAMAGERADVVMSPLTTKATLGLPVDQLVSASLVSGPSLTTTLTQMLAANFIAKHARMQAFCAVAVSHTGTVSVDFIAELRLRSITAGADVKVILGGESVSTGLGYAVRFPMNMTHAALVVGDTYELQIWMRRGTGAAVAGTAPRDLSIDARVFP